MDSGQKKYARIERERRFLLAGFPVEARGAPTRLIHDRYLRGTNLRLREMREEGCPAVYKLTQKMAQRAGGAQQGWITTLYLSAEEFALLSALPADELRKRRWTVPPFGIDVFEGPLEGLILAEAEFASAEEADGLAAPAWARGEVTEDERFTGGRLARTPREEWRGWLREYGMGDGQEKA